MPFQNPAVGAGELIIPGVRSQNFREGEQGWRIRRDGNAQFDSLQAVNTLGATILTADEDITLADTSIIDLINRRPVGMLAYGQIVSSTATGSISTPETGLFRMSFGPVTTESFYMIAFSAFLVRTVPGDAFQIRIRYASGTTMPSTSSPTMPVGMVRIPGGTTGSYTCYYTFPFASPVDSDRINMLLTLERISGTGTASITSNTSDTGFTWFVMDGGLSASATATIAQISKSAGSPDPDPPTTYKKKYNATWSRTFDGDNSTTWDDSAYCYQGYYSNDRGNTRSLVGFDYSQIMSDLAGATISSAKLTFKCAHAYYNSGLTALVGTHDYTAKPSTWDGSRVDERRITVDDVTAGETVTVEFVGTGGGSDFKSGVAKGIAFGPPSSNDRTYYGYHYGASQSGKPFLTFTYKK